MSNSNNASLIETKQTINKILENTKAVNTDIGEISQRFDKIDKNYEDYGSEANLAEKQVKELKLR